jgi:hypothetical protein
MNTERFEKIINKPESSFIDFKKEQYSFSDDKTEIKTAEFIKDIVSFSNTIRAETAYIILGIRVKENGTKELLGINKHIDDAIFQEKIKDKVYPKPHFLYYTYAYQNKLFGIIEIPIYKYSEPIYPVKKMKGLDIGRIYFRRGSSNSEAIGKEIILINNWLINLPENSTTKNINNRISELLMGITSRNKLLSECFSETL